VSAHHGLRSWRELVAACNADEGWRLTQQQCEYYATELAQIAAPDLPQRMRRDIAHNYHHDHRMVAALRNAQHAEHAARWNRWMQQVRRILHYKGFARSSDRAIDDDDLVQIALLALQGALPTYAYRSTFKVWTYSVVVRTLQKQLRDSLRQRRAVRPASLDQLITRDPDYAPPAADGIEANAYLRTFYAEIQRVLAAHPERRLSYLFHLAYIEDRRLSDIGALVQLPPARVRVLLQQARKVLHTDPAIRAWHYAAGECEFGCCAEKLHA
jgi:RNA polymerase sigma factor (sigma-70 family)